MSPINTPQGRLITLGVGVALVSRFKWKQSWLTTAGVAVGAIGVLAVIAYGQDKTAMNERNDKLQAAFDKAKSNY